MRAKFFLSLGLLLCTANAHATFDVEGYLLDSGGNPIVGVGYQLFAAIEKPGDPSCVLSREEISGIATGTNGDFIAVIGSGAPTGGFTGSADSVLLNSGTYQCRTEAGALVGNYTPNPSDVRTLWIKFFDGSSYVDLGRMTISTVPYAKVAENVGGHSVNSLLRVENGGAPLAVPPFTSGDYSSLQALLGGTSSSYIRSNTNTGAVLPVVGGTPPAKTIGSMWFESGTGSLKYFNGTSEQVLSTAGSTITGVAAGSGLTGGGTVGNVTLNLSTTGVIAGTYGTPAQVPQLTVDVYGRITSISTTNISGISPGGSASGDLGGTYPSPIVTGLRGVGISAVTPNAGQFLRYDGSSWAGKNINLNDLKSSVTGSLFPAAGCTAGQTLYWNSGTDTFLCTVITISASSIVAGTIDDARLPASAKFWQTATGGIQFTAGNVSIGTTTPTANLDVTSDGDTTLAINSIASSFPRKWRLQTLGSSGNGRFSIFDQTANLERLTIGASGFVGLGTATPLSKFEVSQGGIRVTSSTPGDGLVIGNGAFSTVVLGGTNAGNDNGVMQLRDASTTNVKLQASGDSYLKGGKLGIGTSSPAEALDVTGFISAYGIKGNGGPLFFDAPPTEATFINWFSSANGLYVGNGTSGGYGPVNAAAFNINSDRRLKTNIENIGDSLDRVSKLNGVRFNWIDPRMGPDRQVGVIAQDVEAVFPELVSTNSQNSRLTVNYAGLVSPLIEAVKTLYAKWSSDHNRIQMLEANDKAKDLELAAIKAENDALRARMDKLEAMIEKK